MLAIRQRSAKPEAGAETDLCRAFELSLLGLSKIRVVGLRARFAPLMSGYLLRKHVMGHVCRAVDSVRR